MPPKLDYHSPATPSAPPPPLRGVPTWNASLATVMTLIPPAALLGILIRSGPLFLLAGGLSIVVVPVSLLGVCLTGRQSGAGCWLAALIMNSLSAAYFVWLIFGRGIC